MPMKIAVFPPTIFQPGRPKSPSYSPTAIELSLLSVWQVATEVEVKFGEGSTSTKASAVNSV